MRLYVFFPLQLVYHVDVQLAAQVNSAVRVVMIKVGLHDLLAALLVARKFYAYRLQKVS